MTPGMVLVELRRPESYAEPVRVPWPAAALPEPEQLVTLTLWNGRERLVVAGVLGWEVQPDEYGRALLVYAVRLEHIGGR